MFRPRLFWKILGSSVVLILLTAIVAGGLAERRVLDDVERETRAGLETRVVLIRAVVADRLPADVDDAFQAQVRDLGRRTKTRITIIRGDGLVLADSSKDPRGMDNHAHRPEVVGSRTAPFGASTRISKTLGARMVYTALALRRGGTIHAYVRGALPLPRLEERMADLRRTILGAAGLAAILGLLGALFFARRLTAPLKAMSAAATAMASGDLARRVEITAHDEVGELGRRFNEMAARLESEVLHIRRERRDLRAILDSMVEGVLAIDGEDRIVLVNDAAGRILDLDTAVAADRPFWESVRIPAIADLVRETSRRGRPQTHVVHLLAERTDRVVHVHAAPLRDERGEAAGVVLVLDDATQRERLEVVRRDFIANASHELKTPIASIRGLVETVLADGDMPASTRNGFLERVVRQIGRLGHLVGEMLTLSRLEAREASPALRAVDLREPVGAAADEAAPLAAEAGVSLEIGLGAEPLYVVAVPESLHRIAGNLLDNAIKYGGPGTAVGVHLEQDGADVILEVRDEGPGIPADKQDRVFERFYRVDESRSREVGGTGLGLAIVKHLVHAHGGRITLDSTPGQGSVFRVVFPATPKPPDAGSAAFTAPSRESDAERTEEA